MNNNNEKQIGIGFSYGSQVKHSEPKRRQNCIEEYIKDLDEARKLTDDFIIFLDTNVLLGFYQLPMTARKELYLFLETNKERIYICDQVYREFTKHHNKVRRIYSSRLTLEQPSAYQASIQAKITDFLEENDDVLAAYPEFKTDLEKVLINSRNILIQLKTLAKERVNHCKKALHEPDLSKLLGEFPKLPALNKREFAFIKAEFDALRKPIEEIDQKHFLTKVAAFLYQHPDKVFPGIGDLEKKTKNPYGDYCIFHELIKWSGNHQPERPIIFLTNDVTKSDWVDINQRAYVHYLECFYLNTGSIFYILHAEAIFSSVLKTPCEHLVLEEEIFEDVEQQVLKQQANDLTIESLQELLQQLYPNRKSVEASNEFWNELRIDLIESFGIKSLLQLKIDLLEHYHLLVTTELNRYQIYDQVDALEVTLELIYE